MKCLLLYDQGISMEPGDFDETTPGMGKPVFLPRANNYYLKTLGDCQSIGGFTRGEEP
jgi:hypothetical protein